MSDQKKEVLLRIRIDEAAAKKQIADFQKQINATKKEQAELNKAVKEAGEATDEQAAAQVALKQKLAELTKQQNVQIKVLEHQEKLDQAKLGSLDRLRAEAVQLKQAYSGLSAEEQANEEIGGKLAAKINEVNVAIKQQTKVLNDNKEVQKYAEGSVYALREAYGELQKKFYELSEEERKGKVGQQMQKDLAKLNKEISGAEQSIGVFSRNVGNYTSSILEALDGSGQLAGGIEILKQGYEQLTSFIDVAKQSIMNEAAEKIKANAAKKAALAATAAETAAETANTAATTANTAAEAANTTATEAGAVADTSGAAATTGDTAATTANTAATTGNTAATAANTTATNTGTTAQNISKAAIIGNVAALKLLKYALAATGIGAVLLLLGGLISFLTRTQKGIDLVDRKTKGFTTILGVLTDKLSSVGQATVDWFDDIHGLGDFLSKLGGEILDNLINRIKGFAVLLDALKNRDFTKLQDGFVQVTTGITDATAKTKEFAKELNEARKSAEAIEKENQRIRDSELQLNEARAQANAQIEKYKLVAEDVTKSEKERADAARNAFQLEESIRNQELQLQRDKIANIEAEQALTNNLYEDNQKLSEEKAKLAEIEAASVGKSIELQNKLNALRQEGAAKAREATLKQLEAEAALLEIRTESALNTEEDLLNLRLQLLQKRTEQELKQENLTSIQKKVIQQKALNEEAKLRDEFREEQRKKELEDAEAINSAAFETAQRVMSIANAKQEMELKRQRAKGLLTEKGYQQELSNLKLTQLQGEVMMLEQFKGKIPGIEEAIAAKRIEISNILADKQIENIEKVEQKELEQTEKRRTELEQQAEDTRNFVTGIGEMFAASLEQQGVDLQKFSQGVLLLIVDTLEKAVNAQVAASIAQSTAAAFAQPDSVATFGASGLARAAILGGLIKAAFAVFKAGIIQATSSGSPDYFADGGIFRGPSHSHGGIQVYNRQGVHIAEVEGDEPVLTKRVSQDPRLLAAASAINVAAGGKPLMRNPYLATGGTLPAPTRQWLGGNGTPAIDYNKLAAAMAKMPPPITRITDVKKGLARDQRTGSISNQ